jgi:hypothetical protein
MSTVTYIKEDQYRAIMKSIFCVEINHHTFEKTHATSSSSFRTNVTSHRSATAGWIANAVENYND